MKAIDESRRLSILTVKLQEQNEQLFFEQFTLRNQIKDEERYN